MFGSTVPNLLPGFPSPPKTMKTCKNLVGFAFFGSSHVAKKCEKVSQKSWMWFSRKQKLIVFGGAGVSIIRTCIFEQILYENHEQKSGLGFRNPEASFFDFVHDCVKIHHHHLRTKMINYKTNLCIVFTSVNFICEQKKKVLQFLNSRYQQEYPSTH